MSLGKMSFSYSAMYKAEEHKLKTKQNCGQDKDKNIYSIKHKQVIGKGASCEELFC